MFWYYLFPPLAEFVAAALIYEIFWRPYCRRHRRAKAEICGTIILIMIYVFGAANFFIRDHHFPSWALWISGVSVALILIWALGAAIYGAAALAWTALVQRKFLRPIIVPPSFKMAYFIFFFIIYPLLGLWGGAQNPHLMHVTIDLRPARPHHPSLAPLDFKLVFISDLHLGTWQGSSAYLTKVVHLANQENPDVVLLGGDLVDHDHASFLPLLQPLQNLMAPGGIYFALGNHECLSPTPHLLEELKTLGVVPLVNQSVLLNGRLNLAGVGDADCGHWGKDYLPQMPAQLDDEFPTILLAHRPNLMRDAKFAAVDLALMGHTHGGQIEPFSILPRITNIFFKGLYLRPKIKALAENKRDFAFTNTAPSSSSPYSYYYVNQGTGTSGPPMRLLTFSEITVIHLHF